MISAFGRMGEIEKQTRAGRVIKVDDPMVLREISP